MDEGELCGELMTCYKTYYYMDMSCIIMQMIAYYTTDTAGMRYDIFPKDILWIYPADTGLFKLLLLLCWHECLIIWVILSKRMNVSTPLYLFFIKRSSLFCKASSINFWELWALGPATPWGRLEVGLRSWQPVRSPGAPREMQNNTSDSGIWSYVLG